MTKNTKTKGLTPSAYGPRMKVDDGRVVSNFIVQSLKGEPITVYGDGAQTRSFCYVDDLIEGIYRLLLWSPPPPTPKAQHLESSPQDLVPVFNLGNPDEIAILDLAREIIEITQSKSRVSFEPLPQDDPKLWQPEINKARRLLEWKPKVSRKEGLYVAISYFEKEAGIVSAR